jgi:hypothetical protein
MRCASSTTASAARFPATSSALSARSRTSGFPEAVRIVAGKCGIPLPKREFSSPEEAAGARQRAKLLELHETATAWFEEQLRRPRRRRRARVSGRPRTHARGHQRIPHRLRARQLQRPARPAQRHGRRRPCAPAASSASKEQGDGTSGPIYDRFRKRVMFPIANESGRVIAFTARTLETGDKAGAKYINSPETPLYSKGQVLFNLDKARTAIRQMEFALLVEGQMDCISVFLRGIQERDRHQRNGLHRAAGGHAAPPHLAGRRQLRSRRRRLAMPPKSPLPCSPKRASPSRSSPSTAASTPTATSASAAWRPTRRRCAARAASPTT